MVEKLLQMGYTSFSEISEHFVYSFSKEEFLTDRVAEESFGWN